MKKVLFIVPVLFSLNSFSQNILMTNIGNQSVPQVQRQVFASNMMVSNSNTNKPARANANPQVNVQRASVGNSNQRRQIRRTTVSSTNISNPVQTNISNVAENNTDEIQQLVNFNDVNDNNTGNAFGNESLIEQIASANIPAIQVGTGSLNLNLDINMPKLKLPSVKLASRKTVSGSRHKTFRVKNKLAKLNRKMTDKLSFHRHIKIKVDNCFKW